MVIDSSALIAMLLREPEEAKFRAIFASTTHLIGAPAYLETAIVLIGASDRRPDPPWIV
jgi:uncharacterized protein with PIN domain